MPHGFLLRCRPSEGIREITVGEGGRRADQAGCTALTAGQLDPALVLARHLEGRPLESPEDPAVVAVWDGRTRRLELVRDRTGLHPLFYSEISGGVVTGPDARAILAEPDVSGELGTP